MRIVHTADWHLGRIFHGVHLTADQAFVLEQFLEKVGELQPDVVVIAGDLYDRAVPPPEAVALLDDVLSRLVLDLGVAVMVIAGNHDSPERLGFGGRLLESARLFVTGRLQDELKPVVLLDEHGPVAFHLLPYVEPAHVRERFAADPIVRGGPLATAIDGHGAALAHLVARARRQQPEGARSVMVAHGSVAGVAECESERPLWVGPHAAEASLFSAFDYTALGHHHRAQDLDGARVRYPGSLLAYSFSEAGEERTFTVVDLDEGPVLDPAGRLRERYPNLLQLEQARLADRDGGEGQKVDVTRLGDRELFEAFFVEVTGHEPSAEELEAFVTVVEAVDREARESGEAR